MFKWTVDVEYDWGGRTNGTKGIKEGLPVILETFSNYGISALFFISTELLREHSDLVKTIRDRGHSVGSHGHFHQKYGEVFRYEADKELSFEVLGEKTHYRAPWFNYETEDGYSQKRGHISVLKYAWGLQRICSDPIFYIHPFDIVDGDKPPSLFTALLYSRPSIVLDTFKRLCRFYPGESLLGKDAQINNYSDN